MKRQPYINFRQKELLRLLLSASSPVTLQELAQSLKVSVRTVQRELNSLESILRLYELQTIKKSGVGIVVSGSHQDRTQLQEDLSEREPEVVFSPEERQFGLIRDLLITKDYVKLFVFSRKYGVSEATISNDLDRVEEWFGNFGIAVSRKPGLGTRLIGTEQQIRSAASHLLQQDMTVEDWVGLFSLLNVHNDSEISSEQLRGIIRSRLMEFVDIPNLISIERIVREEIQEEYPLSDRDYVNLIVHLALSVERIKNGELIGSDDTDLPFPEIIDKQPLARKLAGKLEQELDIVIPEKEAGYIALHLQGTGFNTTNDETDQNALVWFDLAKSFVRAVERHLGESLHDDSILLEGLIAHIASTVKNLRLGLPVQNPLLEQVQGGHPRIFTACRKAAEILSSKTGFVFPDSEIGYLVMHIAGSMLRKKTVDEKTFRVLVVCASGFGTSQYLAARLKQDMPNVEVAANVSAMGVKDWLDTHPPVDLIISTVSLPQLPTDRIVIVSPLLLEGDLNQIRGRMESLPVQSDRGNASILERRPAAMLSVAHYGEAMIQILRNLQVFDAARIGSADISSLLPFIGSASAVWDSDILLEDLERRERLGAFVLDDLAVYHARTSGVKELLLTVIRACSPVPCRNASNKPQMVRVILLLAAPLSAPNEHVEIISEISAALIDDEFLAALRGAPYVVLKEQLEHLLSTRYQAKAESMMKELWGHE